MRPLLETLDLPSGIADLDTRQLSQLAEAVRSQIVETVTENGGHLASSLGVVELTVALHKVFDSPADKLVWDVGHQSYAHKILTGRLREFVTLRQMGGLSGFPKIDESPHDAFGAGHSSTSISAALGLATARDLAGEHHHVIAVIGDGALTGGMALEALNNAGWVQSPLIIIVNDNERSISHNVGAISTHLSALRASPLVRGIRDETRSLLEHARTVGRMVLETGKRVERSVLQIAMPSRSAVIFEELGVKYLGPIDGHDFAQLIPTLISAREFESPVVVHVVTKKGRGHEPAEQDPTHYHGIAPRIHTPAPSSEPLSPANANDENTITTTSSYSEVLGQTLCDLARRDDRITVITAAMTDGNGLSAFAHQFTDRFFDVGIAEQHAVTFAAGQAAAGLRPVVAVYSTFLQRAYDQIVHDVCLQQLPVLFAVSRGGLVGDDGPTHHGAFDLSYLRHIPGMVVMAPRDASELRRMLVTAVELDGPASVRFPRGSGADDGAGELPKLTTLVSECLAEGGNGVFVAIGPMVDIALEARRELERVSGLVYEVVDARFVKPLDPVLLSRLRSAHHVCVVEDNVVAGGLGGAIAEALAASGVRLSLFGLPDQFVEHGPVNDLREKWGLDARSIALRAAAESDGGTGTAWSSASVRAVS